MHPFNHKNSPFAGQFGLVSFMTSILNVRAKVLSWNYFCRIGDTFLTKWCNKSNSMVRFRFITRKIRKLYILMKISTFQKYNNFLTSQCNSPPKKLDWKYRSTNEHVSLLKKILLHLADTLASYIKLNIVNQPLSDEIRYNETKCTVLNWFLALKSTPISFDSHTRSIRYNSVNESYFFNDQTSWNMEIYVNDWEGFKILFLRLSYLLLSQYKLSSAQFNEKLEIRNAILIKNGVEEM